MTVEEKNLRVKYAALLAEISGSAVNAEDAGEFLRESLSRIGGAVDALRVYFAVLSPENIWSALYEWRSPGADSQGLVLAGKKARQDVWLFKELEAGRDLCLDDVRSLSDRLVRQVFVRGGTVSAMVVPVRESEKLTALFGIELGEQTEPVMWPRSVVALFKAIAHTLKMAYDKSCLRDAFPRWQRQFDAMLNAMPGYVYITDMDTYELVSANDRALEALGPDIVGQPCYRVLQHSGAPCSFCPNAQVRAQDTPHVWTHYSEALNRTLQITDRCISLPDGRRVKFSFQNDVTELLEARIAKVKAEEQVQARTDFLARMSHEIRTPMNAIIGFTHLLGRTNLDANQKDYLNKTRIAANSLLHVINDILDFSRIEAGRMEVDRVPFRLSVLLAAVQSIIGFNAKEKKLHFVLDVAADVPDILRGDPGRINQVLLNLLSNAVKFTSEGEIRLRVRLLAVKGEDLLLELQVIDTGMGMTEEQTARLFQPFNQADGSVVRRFGGTGLGLVISKRLVELMGGRIRVESRPGRGSAFIFTLVLGVGNEQEDLARLQADLDQGRDDVLHQRLEKIRGARVLVVDDNAINLEIARELLESVGMDVVEAGGGEEAVALVRAQAFDLVFMDMLMPDVDGLEATRRIREQSFLLPRIAGLPIVAMTANVMASDRERCFESGMNDHIAKPLDPKELSYCLLHWIPARQS